MPRSPDRRTSKQKNKARDARTVALREAGLAPSMGRPIKFTKRRQAIFLDALALTGRMKTAAEAADINYNTILQHRTKDEDFATAIELAKERFCEVLETRAHQLAVEGTLVPQFYNGEPIMVPVDPGKPNGKKAHFYKREFDAATLRFLLGANNPKKYRQSAIPLDEDGNQKTVIVLPAALKDVGAWETKHGRRPVIDVEATERKPGEQP